MNQTDVMLKIVEMAKIGGHMPPDAAISLVAVMIARLEVTSEHYDRDLSALLGVGATIWVMSGGAHEPGWVPPSLRP